MTVRQHYCELCGVELRGKERRYCGPCRENLPARIREDFIREYGGKCQCPGCDVREPTFLSLDHIHNDGARHRRETRVRGWAMYLKIREEGYPKDRYRLLCHNCNMSRAHFGRCVHEIQGEDNELQVSAEQKGSEKAGQEKEEEPEKGEVMQPTIGRIVHYRLSAFDLSNIMGKATLEGVHSVNPHSEGQILPLIICRVWPMDAGAEGVNGQVFLDGTEMLWVTSVKEGTEPGQWSWPERV